jgi:hypothetical protein
MKYQHLKFIIFHLLLFIYFIVQSPFFRMYDGTYDSSDGDKSASDSDNDNDKNVIHNNENCNLDNQVLKERILFGRDEVITKSMLFISSSIRLPGYLQPGYSGNGHTDTGHLGTRYSIIGSSGVRIPEYLKAGYSVISSAIEDYDTHIDARTNLDKSTYANDNEKNDNNNDNNHNYNVGSNHNSHCNNNDNTTNNSNNDSNDNEKNNQKMKLLRIKGPYGIGILIVMCIHNYLCIYAYDLCKS